MVICVDELIICIYTPCKYDTPRLVCGTRAKVGKVPGTSLFIHGPPEVARGNLGCMHAVRNEPDALPLWCRKYSKESAGFGASRRRTEGTATYHTNDRSCSLFERIPSGDVLYSFLRTLPLSAVGATCGDKAGVWCQEGRIKTGAWYPWRMFCGA
ncbi:hypothetical protein BC827DRAFT_135435 [Russula dissimulans]|nr:hypothetical protein BC827DRAFT_135435 [Russula dissimulans]